MKPIEKDELYENLRQFLKAKGIELTEGSYSKGIHAGCSLLADAINLSQTGIERARNEIGKKVDQVRQAIHEKTAPRKEKSAQKPRSSGTNAKSNSQKPGRRATGSPKGRDKR
jgi:hypothetical protein